MQLVGKDFHVRFFRQKRQQIYKWRGKEKEKLEPKARMQGSIALIPIPIIYAGGILLNLM